MLLSFSNLLTSLVDELVDELVGGLLALVVVSALPLALRGLAPVAGGPPAGPVG